MTTITVLHNVAFASKDASVALFCDPVEWLGIPDTTAGSLRIWKVGKTQWRIVVDDTDTTRYIDEQANKLTE